MDNLPNTQLSTQPQVIISPPFYKRKILWIYLLILLLIPLSFYLYKNYLIISPLSQPVPTSSPIVSPANPLIAKAKSIGYDIIWINPKDKTGRTVFYKERAKAETDFRGTGLVYTQATASGAQRLISYVAGTFISFQEIANSPDLYIDLINPQTGISLPKVRLILTKDSPIKTFFRVENLLYGPNNPFDGVKKGNEGNLGILADWTVDKLKKIIQTGDAVVVSLTSKDKNNKLTNQTDSNKELIGKILVIRRFYGQSQVEKELQP